MGSMKKEVSGVSRPAKATLWLSGSSQMSANANPMYGARRNVLECAEGGYDTESTTCNFDIVLAGELRCCQEDEGTVCEKGTGSVKLSRAVMQGSTDMVRKKKTATRPTEDRREAIKKMKVTKNQDRR